MRRPEFYLNPVELVEWRKRNTHPNGNPDAPRIWCRKCGDWIAEIRNCGEQIAGGRPGYHAYVVIFICHGELHTLEVPMLVLDAHPIGRMHALTEAFPKELF